MNTIQRLAVATTARVAATPRPTTVVLRTPHDFRVCAMEAIRNSNRTYKSIAAAADVTPQTVGRLADGTTQYPRMQTVIGILVVLGFWFTGHVGEGTVHATRH